MCYFYTFTCLEDDTSCTPEEVKQGTVRGHHLFGPEILADGTDMCKYFTKLSADPGSVECCSTDLCNKGDTEKKVVAEPMKCYSSYMGSVLPVDCPDSDMCVTYDYQCQAADTSCTEEDVRNGTTKEISTCSKKTMEDIDMCEYFKIIASSPDKVDCCYTSLCNDKSVDV